MAMHRCHGCMKTIEEAVCPHCGYGPGEQNTENQLPAGTVLQGKYLVGKALGQGGFGITYIGCDLDLDLVVAIKEFFPAALVNRENTQSLTVRVNAPDLEDKYHQNRSRFLKEAKALAKLQDVPQIVGIRGFFEENNTAYIVMEYVRGMDLRHYVRSMGGRLTVEQLLPLLDPVLQALDRVHKAGLVHRDVSPDNIMILPDGGIKLLDFGAVRDAGGADADIDLSHSTEAILKHGFAPMEQYRSRGNLGPWTDEYGICASAYYCLTGRVPPDAPSRAMGEAEVDWNAVPGLEAYQRAALEKGMSMRAKDRFGDLEALRQALDGKTETVPARPEETREITATTVKKSGSGILIAGVLLLAAVIGGTLLFRGNENRQEPVMDVPPADTAASVLETSEAPETTEPAAETEVPATEAVPAEPWEANVLRQDPLAVFDMEKGYFTSATFLDATADAPADAVDVSADGSGKVLAWRNGSDVFFAAEGGIHAGESCHKLFDGCYNLTKVSFGEAYHTEKTVSMAYMFSGCERLDTVDLNMLDTRSVQNMEYMFALRDVDDILTTKTFFKRVTDCVQSVDVGGWDVSSVTNMRGMFAGCMLLDTVDVSCWDVSSVTDMRGMFSNCLNLKFVDVSRWNTANVTDMAGMFGGCSVIRDLDVSRWNTAKVQDMSFMFYYCGLMTTLDVSGWDVSCVKDMSEMFDHCSKIQVLDTANWDVSNVTNMAFMFYECRKLQTLNADNWDVSNVTDMQYMFNYCSSLWALDVGNWDVSKVANADFFFSDERKINGKNWRSFFQK